MQNVSHNMDEMINKHPKNICFYLCQHDKSCNFLCLHQQVFASIYCHTCDEQQQNITCRSVDRTRSLTIF